MSVSFPLKSLTAAALLCVAVGAAAAPPLNDELRQLLKDLGARMQRLEQRNDELERTLRERPAAQPQLAAAGAGEVEARVAALEAQHARTERSLESETLSETEPELTARLKAVEMQARSAQGTARKMDALDGISAGLNLSTVAQKPFGAPSANSQLNYRGDAFVALPLARIGDIEQRVYTQFRIGQGAGLNDRPGFSKPNATAFRVLGGLRPDDSVAVLAQAWYQASIALPYGGYKPRSRETLEVNFGKMDPFAFFDQNAAASDETRQFTNTIFVHNPLLDAGGDIGVDANGFAPGFRLSYLNTADKPQTWRVSLGVFGAGEKGSNYQRSLASPLLMLQAETAQRMFGGLPGNYRVYAWRNAQAGHFDTQAVEAHGGLGVSADQRVGDGITLFARVGRQLQGHVRFDQAVTAGAEIGGAYWNSSGDSVGLAAGWLKTSQDYRTVSGFGGAERVAELYYRYRVGKQFELSPNLQYIDHPAGDGGAGAVKILGLRAQLTY